MHDNPDHIRRRSPIAVTYYLLRAATAAAVFGLPKQTMTKSEKKKCLSLTCMFKPDSFACFLCAQQGIARDKLSRDCTLMMARPHPLKTTALQELHTSVRSRDMHHMGAKQTKVAKLVGM